MKLVFDHNVFKHMSEEINESCDKYLEIYQINYSDLKKNNYLYNINLLSKEDNKIYIKIFINEEILYNLVSNNSPIPCHNSLINILNMYKSENDINLNDEYNKKDVKSWIITLYNNITNHNSSYSYYDNNIIKLSDKLFYNKSSNIFLTTPPLKTIKSYNGGCIIDTVGINNKNDLYTIIQKKSLQTNNTILKKSYKGYKINRFITSDKTLIICPKNQQKQIKYKIKYLKSIILTNNNYNKLTLNNIEKVKVIICSYTFLNSLLPEEYKIKNKINEYLFGNINNFFNNSLKINPFIVYWEKVIMFNYDHLFKQNNKNLNRIHTLLKIIESHTQWIFINNKPNKDKIEYIAKQLFRTDNIGLITNELIKNILVNKTYDQNIIKPYIIEKIEHTMKEKIIINSNILFNSKEVKRELEKNYPLLFGDIVVDFIFFSSIENINKYIFKRIKNKIVKYDTLLSKFENEESISYNFDILKKKINKANSQIKYFKNLFQKKKFDCCPICINDIKDNSISITKCGHVFCYYCILQSIIISNFNHINCPQCREKLRFDNIYTINKEDNNLYHYGAKISKLINKLNNSEHKIVVLSKWGRILKYLKELFKLNSIKKNKYLLLSYNQLYQLENKYKTCIMLDPPPKNYNNERINYYCDSIIKYTLNGIDNNIS